MDCCDNCKHYTWYYDWCDKWKSKIDSREIHNCYEKYDTPIYDMMVGAERKENLFELEQNTDNSGKDSYISNVGK